MNSSQIIDFLWSFDEIKDYGNRSIYNTVLGVPFHHRYDHLKNIDFMNDCTMIIRDANNEFSHRL